MRISLFFFDNFLILTTIAQADIKDKKVLSTYYMFKADVETFS